ncbi:hypothetical protein B0T11DRAFT_269342 [Plectosphaerella cucumerina]|uniref:Uncharacterized protein n=1 Tax=Plectosphaerella cucumerina TaxID=40658 RepID=A0A8K0TSD2_9PEZI|nr:hypothetical protein B0T11DRAFT_269342 [Plectosphaerella cucumerina]
MADSESTARLGAEAAAKAQQDRESQQNQQQQTAQSFRLPNIDASASAAGSAQQSQPQDPKIDPAGFFVHVNNTKFGDASPTAQQTHHPNVQYIFSDDDPAVLSAALADAHTRNTASTASARANPTREHGILVDVEPITDPKTGKHTGGWKVASASSLSGDFAVTDAKISRMDDSSSAAAVGGSKSPKAGTDTDTGGTIMLKIDGVEMTDDDDTAADSLPSSQSADKSVSGERENYLAIMGQFDRHMSIMKRIMEVHGDKSGKNRAQADDQELGQPETKREGKDLDGEESG